jgi:peptidoglycan/xylan/chitin deacetylase (PgdA/CDA1 family)
MGFFMKPKKGVHIINAHYVTPGNSTEIDTEIFENFLKNITNKAKLVSLEAALQLIEKGKGNINDAYVTLTFDDGFEECYSTIAPLIEKYGSTGAFFINANYIESDINYQEKFNERTQTYTKKPMSWAQVIDLHHRGHLIGSHNLDHTNMSVLNEEDLDFQLKQNKKILENKLNYTCNYFAWTYGQMQHFPERALIASLKYHDFIFSGTDYKNYFSRNNKVINRRHIEPFWNKYHMNYFLSVNKE